MCGVVDAGEMLKIEVRINLRGCDIGVSEQFLYGQFLSERLALDQEVEPALHVARRYAIARFTQKQCLLASVTAVHRGRSSSQRCTALTALLPTGR